MASLFLIPTTLDNNISSLAIPATHLEKIKHLTYFIVETAKVARAHIKHLELETPIQQLNISELNKHSKELTTLIQPLLDGHDVGLISDCGMPAIADPGNQIVKLAHQNNIKVCPFAGPNSLMMGLMASGVNGQNFAFNGYLPTDLIKRKNYIKRLNDSVTKYNQSQIIIETPFRNNHLLKTLIEHLSPQIRLSISINLMNETEQTISKTISEWRQQQLPDLNKQETVFTIGN